MIDTLVVLLGVLLAKDHPIALFSFLLLVIAIYQIAVYNIVKEFFKGPDKGKAEG